MYQFRKYGLNCFIAFLFFLLFFLSTGQAAQEANADKIIAVVNDMIITQSEAQEYLNFIYLQLSARLDAEKLKVQMDKAIAQALNRLVEDKLILQEAIKAQIKIEEAAIEARIREFKARFETEEKFNQELIKSNISVSELKKNIREQELMRAIIEEKIRSKIYISPNEITLYYQQHSQEFNRGAGVRISFAQFLSKDKAKQALAKLSAGSDFTKVCSQAQDYRLNQDLRLGEFMPEVENQIFVLAAGEVSEVIELEDKFYIFKVLAKLDSEQLKLSQVQGAIYEKLFQEKMSKDLTAWLDELKDKAYIVIK